MCLKPNAYAPIPPYTWDDPVRRTPLPVYPPPEPLVYPSLPSAPRKPAFSDIYTLSTHIVPGCHLRTAPQVPVPTLPDKTLPKAQLKKRLLEIKQELDDIRGSTITDGFPVLMWNVINRYVKNGLNEANKKGITLFVVSAIGFQKEIWEPFLHHLLTSNVGASIDEVWAWESIQHGDSALVNKDSLSGVWDWHDNSRDMINFFTNFMPTQTNASELPVHLPRLSEEESKSRVARGFSERQMIVIGHSMGGCTAALASLINPHFFKALLMTDPVIIAPNTPRPIPGLIDFTLGALSRRDQWRSQQEAVESFSKNPFFQAWDPAILKIYLECGTYQTTDANNQPVVRLKTSAIQEAIVYAEIHTDGEVYDQIQNIDPRIPIRWIMPGRPGAPELGGPGTTEKRVWLRRVNATNTRISGGGHLTPLEAPLELAEDVQGYLAWLFATNYGQTEALLRSNL